MLPTVLFDESSITGVSLTHFAIGTQVTIAALGIPAGVEITFEMVRLSSPVRPQICPGSCEIPPVEFAKETAWQPLMCCNGNKVKVTAANPYTILDSPQHVRLRALMTGYDFSVAPFPGEIIVFPSTSTIPHDAARGCCEEAVVTPPNCVPVTSVTSAPLICPGPPVVQYTVRTTTVRDSCTNAVTSTLVEYRLTANTAGTWTTTVPVCCEPVPTVTFDELICPGPPEVNYDIRITTTRDSCTNGVISTLTEYRLSKAASTDPWTTTEPVCVTPTPGPQTSYAKGFEYSQVSDRAALDNFATYNSGFDQVNILVRLSDFAVLAIKRYNLPDAVLATPTPNAAVLLGPVAEGTYSWIVFDAAATLTQTYLDKLQGLTDASAAVAWNVKNAAGTVVNMTTTAGAPASTYEDETFNYLIPQTTNTLPDADNNLSDYMTFLVIHIPA